MNPLLLVLFLACVYIDRECSTDDMAVYTCVHVILPGVLLLNNLCCPLCVCPLGEQTVLVATISPADICFAETLSTLKFAQRAKSIKNTAVVNEETVGSVVALQHEILALKLQLAKFHANGSSVGGLSNAPEDVPAVSPTGMDVQLAVRSEMEVLKEAMDRCYVADERRQRCESEVAVLTRRLAETEKSVLSVKMQLKMRDAEVKRLKSKDPAAFSECPSVEDMVRVDVEAVRQEHQSEVVKYKLHCEELQRRLDKYERNEMCSWQQSQEVTYNHDMLQQLLESEAKVEDMFFRIEAAARGDFHNACGISVEEALDIKEHYSDLKGQVEELRMTNESSSMTIMNSFNTLREVESAAVECKVASEKRLRELEQAVLASDNEVISLKERLDTKEQETSDLLSDLKRMEEDGRKGQEDSESARVAQYNKLMKDNMVLLKRNRELEKEREDNQLQLKRYEDEISALMQRADTSHMTAQARITQLGVKIYSLETELGASRCERTRLETEVVAQKEQYNDLLRQKASCEEQLQDRESTLLSVREDLEKATCDLQCCREDVDSLQTQAETLLDEVAEIKAEMQSISIEKEAAFEDVYSREVALEHMHNEMEVLERTCARLEFTTKILQDDLKVKIDALCVMCAEKEACDVSLQRAEERVERLEADMVSATDSLAVTSSTVTMLEEALLSSRRQGELLLVDLTQREECVQQLETSLATCKETIDVLEGGMLSKKGEVDELTAQLHAVKEKVAALETRLSTSTETIAVLEQALVERRDEVSAMTMANNKLQDQLLAADEGKVEMKSKLENVQGLCAEMKAQYESGVESIASLTEELIECNRQLTLATQKEEELTALHESLLLEKEKSLREIERLTAAMAHLEDQVQGLTVSNEKLQSDVMMADQVKFSLTSEYSELSDQCSDMDKVIQQLTEKVDEMGSALAEAENKYICKKNEVGGLVYSCGWSGSVSRCKRIVTVHNLIGSH